MQIYQGRAESWIFSGDHGIGTDPSHTGTVFLFQGQRDRYDQTHGRNRICHYVFLHGADDRGSEHLCACHTDDLLVSVFNDVKFSVQINIGTVILSLIMTIGGAFTGKFGYQGSDEAIVQVTAMILVAVYSIYAAQTSNANNQQKMENIKEAQSKTELLLSDISNMSQQMQSGMEDIYGKVENLNSASKLTKDAMSEVGSGTTETANAVQTQMQQTEAIQQKVEMVSSVAERINQSMQQTLQVLESAGKDMDVLVSQVDHSVEKGDSVAGQLETLDKYIEEMHSIVELISGITSQTSLLALNASIEAARAGEAGRGFSVVATEISGMATQTKEATVHITELIENISNAISEVVSVVREMIGAINEEKQSTENTANNFRISRAIRLISKATWSS